jgi:hypothetical protein
MVELVLAVHFFIILFVIVGLPVGLIVDSRPFRIIHVTTLAAIALLMVLGIPCPLTILEETLRQAPVYEGSFIGSWLNRIIYLEDFDASFVPYLAVGFLVLTVSSFFWKPLNPAK